MLTSEQASCFLEKIWNFKRSGPDLVAESESLFSKEVFVFHAKDEDLLKKLVEIPDDTSFLIMIIGIPGVGKSNLLLTLLHDELTLPENIRTHKLWKAARQKYNFLDLSHPFSSRRDRTRKNVWIVPTVDEYYSPSSSYKISGLLDDIRKYMQRNDSIILAGNQGMFIATPGDPRNPRDKIKDTVKDKVANPTFENYPYEPWIKEYGGDPNSKDDIRGFQDFSIKTLEFVIFHIKECYKNGCALGKQELCKKFQNKLQETLQMIEEPNFNERLHDLICSMRLRHQDLFLTPRTLLVFWSDFCSNLLQQVSGSVSNEKEIIYEAIFESCLISSLYSQSYRLHETNLDIFRSKEIDKILLNNYSKSLENDIKRRAARLKIYFESEINSPRKMIYEGAYADFIDQNKSLNILKNVFRYFFVYADKRFQRKLIELEEMFEREEWLPYTFLTECWRGTKKEFITNKAAIEEFVDKYTPVSVCPIDFEGKRSRKVELKLKETKQLPYFNVDLETFLPFRMLNQGFYLDFSMYPDILSKIEIVLSETRDIFRQFLLKWFSEHMSDKDRRSQTYISVDGFLKKGEKPWT